MSLIEQIGQKWLLSFILHISDLSSSAVWTAPSTALKKTNTPKDLIMWINETLQALEGKKKSCLKKETSLNQNSLTWKSLISSWQRINLEHSVAPFESIRLVLM